MNYHDLLHSKSITTLSDPHLAMPKYDSYCTSRNNCFDLAGIPSFVFEPEPLNAFDSIGAILADTVEGEPFVA